MLVVGALGTPVRTLADWIAAQISAEVVDAAELRRKHDGPEADRYLWASLTMARQLRESGRPLVVIDRGAQFVLEPGHSAFVLELDANVSLRAQRLTGAASAARVRELRVADQTLRRVMGGGFAVNPAQTSARWRRSDLVVGCPKPNGCPDLSDCAKIQMTFASAALDVYQAHLSEMSAAESAFAAFAEIAAAHPGYVRAHTTALAHSDRGVGMQRWRDRALDAVSPTEERSHA